jgi:hypothetical protein
VFIKKSNSIVEEDVLTAFFAVNLFYLGNLASREVSLHLSRVVLWAIEGLGTSDKPSSSICPFGQLKGMASKVPGDRKHHHLTVCSFGDVNGLSIAKKVQLVSSKN